jgi:cell division protein FtsB
LRTFFGSKKPQTSGDSEYWMGLSSTITGHLANLRRLGDALSLKAERPENWLESLAGYRRKLATLVLAGLTLMFAYHVIFGANGMLAYRHKRSEYRQLRLSIDRLEKENQELADHNKALQSDPEAIEREAREQLRYARPDDIVVVLPGNEPDTPPRDASAEKR